MNTKKILALAKEIAALTPEGPAPTTITSKFTE